MKKLLFSLLLLMLTLGLTACSDDDSSTKEKSKDAKVSDTVKEKVNDNGVIDTQLYVTNWSDNWRGLKTKIMEVSIIKMDPSVMEKKMMKGEGIVTVMFKLENTSKEDINTYPNQATLLVDGQQVEPSMLASDSIGGELLKSAKKEGIVKFEIPKLNDVKEIKKVRLKWLSNIDSNKYDGNNYKENDITIDLK